MKKQTAFLLLFLAAACIHAQSGEDIYGSVSWDDPKDVNVQNHEMVFTEKKFKNEKRDSVFYMCKFNGDWILMLSMFTSDSFLFNKWGMYALVADPNGRTYWYTTEIGLENIRISKDSLFVTDGKNTVYGSDMTYYLQFDFKGFRCNLTYRNVLPPWKAGDGWVYLTKDRNVLEYRIITSPWAQVDGFIAVDGKRIQVQGQGYGEKCLIVGPLTKLNPFLHSLRLYSPDSTPQESRWHLGLLETISNKEYQSKKIPLLVLAHGNEWIFTTHTYTLEPLDPQSLKDVPYTYPGKLRIEAEHKGMKLEGVFASTRLFHFTDVFDDIPKWIKSFLLLFVKRPVYFRTVGTFIGYLTMPDGTVQYLNLSGAYEYVVVQ